MKTRSFLLIAILFTSCDVQKRALKNKENRTLTEQTETKTYRKGDTISYLVPKVIYKDTAIYTVNRQGTTLRTVYDNAGQITQIDCFASMIEEITKSNRQLVEAIKNKDQEKTESLRPEIILYFMAGLGILMLIGFGLFYRLIKKKGVF